MPVKNDYKDDKLKTGAELS